MTEYTAKQESHFVKLLIQQNEIGGKRKTVAAIKRFEQALERIIEVCRIIKRLYEDNVNGKIFNTSIYYFFIAHQKRW